MVDMKQFQWPKKKLIEGHFTTVDSTRKANDIFTLEKWEDKSFGENKGWEAASQLELPLSSPKASNCHWHETSRVIGFLRVDKG